jgi:hypothetical protein
MAARPRSCWCTSGFEKGRWLKLHKGGWSYFIGRLAEYCKKNEK